jgi:hypothetical protein
MTISIAPLLSDRFSERSPTSLLGNGVMKVRFSGGRQGFGLQQRRDPHPTLSRTQRGRGHE